MPRRGPETVVGYRTDGTGVAACYTVRGKRRWMTRVELDP